MPTEIEAKFKVNDLAPYAQLAQSLNATKQPAITQRDTFFDLPNRSLLKADSGLRIRQIDNRAIICYKGPCQGGPYKKRLEIEVPTENHHEAFELLQALGYQQTLMFEKHRTIYLLNSCQVCFDQVALLGNFIVIEGPNQDQITKTRNQLNLAETATITDSYASMLAQKLTGKPLPLKALL